MGDHAALIQRWRDNFFARRWRGELPRPRLFWRDMLVVGTLINLVASFGALMLAAQGAPLGLAVALHFAPVPYNLFLFAALWRMPRRSWGISMTALAWLVLMALL